MGPPLLRQAAAAPSTAFSAKTQGAADGLAVQSADWASAEALTAQAAMSSRQASMAIRRMPPQRRAAAELAAHTDSAPREIHGREHCSQDRRGALRARDPRSAGRRRHA